MFDVAIVDMFMADTDGFETINAFHRYAPAIPIIAMSALSSRAFSAMTPDFLRMAVSLGASRCLRKPFGRADLISAIETCLCDPVDGDRSRHDRVRADQAPTAAWPLSAARCYTTHSADIQIGSPNRRFPGA
jgi:CheY-like chemotaxis protein